MLKLSARVVGNRRGIGVVYVAIGYHRTGGGDGPA